MALVDHVEVATKGGYRDVAVQMDLVALIALAVILVWITVWMED